MRSKLFSLLCLLTATATACGGGPRTPPESHSGWTVRYAQRVGEGSTAPRDVRPDVVLALLDGRAEVTQGEVRVQLDRVSQRAAVCRAGTCVPGAFVDALAAATGTADLRALANATESDPVVEPLEPPLDVAGLPTRGARFTGAVQHGGARVRIAIEVRWIEQPGDASVEAAKDLFVAPIERLGATQLAHAIRTTAGLPLAWEVRLVNERGDGTSSEGVVSYRAAQVGNPPARLAF